MLDATTEDSLPFSASSFPISPRRLLELADRIESSQAAAWRKRFDVMASLPEFEFAIAVLSAVAFPCLAGALEACPELASACVDEHFLAALDGEVYAELLQQQLGTSDKHQWRAGLCRFAREHKLRIALRELLASELGGGCGFEVTAGELSALAEVLVDAALRVATDEVGQRFGQPHRNDGASSALVVLGMGKLAGRELNAGSDIDLIYVYDTDEGSVTSPHGAGEEISLHQYWARVAQRLTSILNDLDGDGLVWRVDLRLRPEGKSGPIVNSVPAMLRYYETWGRLWERAALARARPIAGDRQLGASLLRELEPFVFRRHVDPSIATELVRMVARARIGNSGDVASNLKLGPGGIRDIEILVQILQLIWGGVDPSLRALGTLPALQRLWVSGLVTDREAKDLEETYVLLRRAEHMIQNATGLQTHSLPRERSDRQRIARCLGYSDLVAFDEHLARDRARVSTMLLALCPEEVSVSRWAGVLHALDEESEPALHQELSAILGVLATTELTQDVMHLGRSPDAFLGPLTRERHAGHADAVLDALSDSADPEQAARYLRLFFGRHHSSPVLVSLLADNMRATRRLVTLLGASAFVGEAVVSRPAIGAQIPFWLSAPSEESTRAEVAREISSASPASDADFEADIGALRRAKLRVTLEVALADISGGMTLPEAQRVLSVLADASIEHALSLASRRAGSAPGFCVLAVGKYGGQELGYASDLDVFFVFDPEANPDGDGAMARYVRVAQDTIRFLSVPHADGPGYQLDTRLRPSGSQGVLVSSLSAFARYHGVADIPSAGVGVHAAPWERQTLIRARPCAGDRRLGARVIELAHVAAYELGPPDPAETHRIRTRLECEVGRERRGRYDIKLGKGALLDIEFAVQTLQMRHGSDPNVRVAGTLEAIDRLETGGYLASHDSATLRDGYLFLRTLEQRLHIVHATSINLLEADAPGLVPLARRMGLHDTPTRSASEQLMERYRSITERIREGYLRLLGLTS